LTPRGPDRTTEEQFYDSYDYLIFAPTGSEARTDVGSFAPSRIQAFELIFGSTQRTPMHLYSVEGVWKIG
jgi:hypothetical protein